jgi:hypothetical protein
MTLRVIAVTFGLLVVPFTALGQLTGGLPALKEDLANEALQRQLGDAGNKAAVEGLKARVEALEAAVAALKGPGTCWSDVYAYDLASQPPGSTTANGAYQGQGPATQYGRACWVQDSDWNLLFVSAPQDDVFAIEADVFLPAPIPYDRNAGFSLFIERTGRGMQVVLNGQTDGARIDWWAISESGVHTKVGSKTVGFTLDQWHRFRVEGTRSTCTLRALVDGSAIDSWSGACDLTGSLYALASGGVSSTTAAEVGWSNLRVQKGFVCSK